MSEQTTQNQINCDELIKTFANFLNYDIANGQASGDTIVTYWTNVKLYLKWCEKNNINPLEADRETIKIYRWWMISEKQYKSATIELKLTAVTRFYDAAIEYGLLIYNPALGIKAPTERIDPCAKITYLEEAEANLLLQSISGDNPLKIIRDKLLIGIMLLEGTRTIEMHSCNIGAIVRQGAKVGIKVTGKRQIRVVPLTPEITKILDEYLHQRRAKGYDVMTTSPLLINLSPYQQGERLSRRGIRKIVDYYLQKAQLKYTPGRTLSAHSLRHTAGTLALRHGASLRQVQDLLGHSDPRTTAIYTHVGDRWAENPALKLGISFDNQE